MRINQLRSYDIHLDESEALPVSMPKGLNVDKGFVNLIMVRVKNQRAVLVFEGWYFDFFDLEEDPNHEGHVRPKKKKLHVESSLDNLRVDDPIRLLLDKLNLMRQDEMSMEQFMTEDGPVG